VFEQIVIGVEESPESLAVVRQASRLLEPDGRLVLTAVADVALAVQAGWAATQVLEAIKSEARAALSAACTEAPGAEAVLLDGAPADALLTTAHATSEQTSWPSEPPGAHAPKESCSEAWPP